MYIGSDYGLKILLHLQEYEQVENLVFISGVQVNYLQILGDVYSACKNDERNKTNVFVKLLMPSVHS